MNAVLPVVSEATKKERAMMGSKVVSANLKRKREPSPLETGDDSGRDYFFAKFLTSPELLELEVRIAELNMCYSLNFHFYFARLQIHSSDDNFFSNC